jgi:hypothetical protein
MLVEELLLCPVAVVGVPVTANDTAVDLSSAPPPLSTPPPSPPLPTPPPPAPTPELGDESQDRIGMFLSEICTVLPPPVLSTPAPRRRARPPATEDGLPRRSTRVVAQGRHRVSNPEVQAQNVLMHKLGITFEKRPLDADAIKAYNDIFNSRWDPQNAK